MSLINDVLRDLERRKAGHTPSSREAPVAATRPGPRRWALWLLMAAMAGGLLHWMLSEHLPRGTPEPVLAAMTADNPVVSRPAEASRGPARVTDELPGPPAVSEPSSTGQADVPATAPPDAAEEASERPRQAEAAPGPETAGDEASRDAPVRAEASGDDTPIAARQTTATASRNSKRSQAATPSIHIEKAGEPERPGQDRLDDARRALARGHFELAESHARALLADHPKLTDAHRLLARALLRQGRTESAVKALEGALNIAAAPDQLAALLGRILFERGEIARARVILERHRPEPMADPDYHLLLAAVQRQAGDHEAAAGTYRVLGGIIPSNARVWIGLGASMESLERFDQAVAAYERALDSPDLPAARFARQRIEQLK